MIFLGGGGSGPPSGSVHESHTFVEIDHEMISTVILLPSTDSRRAVVSYKRKSMHEVLVKAAESSLPRKKVWLGELTIAADWDIKHLTKPKNMQ